MVGNAGANSLTGTAYSDTITGGKGADLLTGGTGMDTFVFAPGDSGQSTNFDRIADYTTGNTGTGDLIDYSAALTVGGSAVAADGNHASINATTAIASFASGSGTTLIDALGDVATRFTEATDTPGEFALFKVGGLGDYYLFMSDGAAGVTANDVVVQLTGVTSFNQINLNGGNLTLNTSAPPT